MLIDKTTKALLEAEPDESGLQVFTAGLCVLVAEVVLGESAASCTKPLSVMSFVKYCALAFGVRGL
jgi:hypothetical protein